MSCCGKGREELLRQSSPAGNTLDTSSPAKMASDVYFEYTGETGLTVIGSLTRTRYRFAGKGNRQLIDYRDASGIMAVPMLKRLKA
jgi:hypothetical protein